MRWDIGSPVKRLLEIEANLLQDCASVCDWLLLYSQLSSFKGGGGGNCLQVWQATDNKQYNVIPATQTCDSDQLGRHWEGLASQLSCIADHVLFSLMACQNINTMPLLLADHLRNSYVELCTRIFVRKILWNLCLTIPNSQKLF